jgi:hypothetical protein
LSEICFTDYVKSFTKKDLTPSLIAGYADYADLVLPQKSLMLKKDLGWIELKPIQK